MLDESPLACANGGDPFCAWPLWLQAAAKTKEAGLHLKAGTAISNRALARVGEPHLPPTASNLPWTAR